MAFGVFDFEVFELLGPVDAGALLRELQQVEFFAPLGHGESHAVEKHRGRRQEGHDHLAGQPGGDLLDDVLDAEGQHLGRLGIDARGEPHVCTPTMEPWRMRTKLQ